jgi:predicted enzyme related to lactoylglutathione lyase
MSGNPYINIMLNGTSVAGIMQIDESWGEVPPFWGVYVGVENIDAALEATPKLGGKIVMPIIEIPVGRFAGILDPTGAMITLIQMNEWPAN